MNEQTICLSARLLGDALDADKTLLSRLQQRGIHRTQLYRYRSGERSPLAATASEIELETASGGPFLVPANGWGQPAAEASLRVRGKQ